MTPAWSLFPKLYGRLSVPELAELVRYVGLDSVNAIVRRGYWVDDEAIAEDLPAFIRAAREEGLVVTRAETTYSAARLLAPDSPFPVLRDCGIKEFRIGWFPRATHDVRGELDHARAMLGLIADAGERYGVKAVYQLHHRTLVTNPTTAYHLVRDLDPRWIGVELDPGNQAFEGFEPWDHACELLQRYVAWVGVKDTRIWQEIPRIEEAGKGWVREFCPLQEGVTNWQELVHALAGIDFGGTFVFMPFYAEYDDGARTERLKAEVEYLKALVESAGR